MGRGGAGRHRRRIPDRVTRRELLAGGVGAVAAVAAGAALGSRGTTLEAPRRWPETARERFLAGPAQDHDLWFRPFWTRPWTYAEDRATYEVPLVSQAPLDHVPEPIWRMDVDCRDGDIHAILQLSEPTMSAGVLFRGDGFARAYAAMVMPDGRLEVARHAELRREVLGEASHAIPPLAPFHLRLELTGKQPRLRARAWPSGLAEPPFWQVDEVDDSPEALQRPGPMGIVVGPPAPDRSGTLTIWGSIVRSDEVPFPTPAGMVAAFAGPPEPDPEQPGRVRVRLRARSALPSSFRFQVEDEAAGPEEPTVVPRPGMGAAGTAGETVIRGVRPGATLRWSVTAQREEGGFPSESPTNRLTVPGPGEPVSIAFASCTFPRPVHRSFATIAGLEPSLFLHLGDLGYPHSSRWSAATATADAYVDRWSRLLAEPPFRRLHTVAPVSLQQDDHDYGANNCWIETCQGWADEGFDEVSANPRDYFRVPLGDVEVFVLDVRKFATDPQGPDGPTKSRLGLEQREWLLDAMTSSAASLLVVASPTPLRTRIPADPSWETAYVWERRELLGRWLELDRRVVVLSGDAHGARLMANADPSGGGRVVFDLLASGTEQDSDVGKPVDIHDPDHVTDPGRFLALRADCFGWLQYEPAGTVTLRSRASADGHDLFEPLEVPVAW